MLKVNNKSRHFGAQNTQLSNQKSSSNQKNPSSFTTKSSFRSRPEDNSIELKGRIKSDLTSNLKRPKEEELLNKYKMNRSSESGAYSGCGVLKAAPSNQYKKYLDDDRNIFYEDSQVPKKLQLVIKLRTYLTLCFVIGSIFYFFIGRIAPFPKDECPRHAQCGVFLHCYKGYVEEDGECIVDPKLKDQALNICNAAIQQLSYEYGSWDCGGGSEQQIRPKSQIWEIYEQFNITDPLIKEQVAKKIRNKQYQEEKNIQVKFHTISPNQKKYSLLCGLQVFSRSPNFIYFVILLIGPSFLLSKGCIFLWKDRKASLIYQRIRQLVKEKKFVRISEQKRELQNLYGKWNDELWVLIDRKRVQDGAIVYYYDEEQLYWKLLE